MNIKIKKYLYNVIATNDGFETFNNVTTYLRDLLDNKEISSYSISPAVKTRQQFNNRQYFGRALIIAVDGEANDYNDYVVVDFSLTGIIYSLGILDEEDGIQRSLDDFGNTIRSVADSEWLDSFNKNIGIFYTFYKDMVGE
jgi:hypothetical protein